MKIVIEQIAHGEDITAMLEVWHQVFEREMGIVPPRDGSSSGVSHLLARLEQSGEPVGTLSVVDTSAQHQLHESLGLGFDPEARVARFTHLAVLKSYRGNNIPLAMMLEAHRRVVVPGEFDYTWLLFNVERAPGSFLSRLLGFNPLPQTFVSEYGCRCPLIRDERTPEAKLVIRQAERYLKQYESLYTLAGVPARIEAVSALS